MQSSPHIAWQTSTVTRTDREQRHNHQGRVLWLTGLPGSGKSTLAFALEQELFHQGKQCYVLDGDNIRHGLNRDLGFSETDRKENLRRIGEVAKLFLDAGHIVIAAFVSPYEADRQMVREMFAPEDFNEIHVHCSLAICEERDPKGLYAKARAGELHGLTGIDAPYEEPITPELVINTELLSPEESVILLMETLEISSLSSSISSL